MSGVEAVGVIASAAQLVDLSVRLVSAISRLCRQFRDHPQNLLKRQHNLEQLIQITKIIQSTKLPDVEVLRTILESSIADAQALLALIEPLFPEHRDSKTRRGWKAVCGIAKEMQILDALRQLEGHQKTLLLCIGYTNTKLLSNVDKSILDLSTSAYDALREVPNIRQSLENITDQIQNLILSEQSNRTHQPWVNDNSSATTADGLALSGMGRSEESMSLQRSTIQIVVNRQMLHPLPELTLMLQ